MLMYMYDCPSSFNGISYSATDVNCHILRTEPVLSDSIIINLDVLNGGALLIYRMALSTCHYLAWSATIVWDIGGILRDVPRLFFKQSSQRS